MPSWHIIGTGDIQYQARIPEAKWIGNRANMTCVCLDQCPRMFYLLNAAACVEFFWIVHPTIYCNKTNPWVYLNRNKRRNPAVVKQQHCFWEEQIICSKCNFIALNELMRLQPVSIIVLKLEPMLITLWYCSLWLFPRVLRKSLCGASE